MHIRLLALGTRGDVQPYIALGLGLQQAGFEVSLGTTSNFKTFVEDWGLTSLTSDVDMQAIIAKAGSRRKAKWEVFRVLLEQTVALSQGADMLIYSGAALFTAPHAAEKGGFPAIPALVQPAIHPTRSFPSVGMPALSWGGWYNNFTYGFVDWLTWTFTKSQVNRWRGDKLGLPPASQSAMASVRQGKVPTLFGFSPSVLPKPPEWDHNVHVTGYWFLPEKTWQPPTELLQFLDAGAPPVYIGFGSMASNNAEQTTRIVLDAVKQAGVRAVLASGWGGLAASALPANVMLIESAPHEWLFPRMAAVVHHGGAGTTAAGLRAGVPTVIIPFGGDQPFWGHHVHALGVGPKPIPQRQLSAEKLADAIRESVNDPQMQAKSAALGQKIRAEDGVTNAVRVIETIAKSQNVPVHS
jgi:sterol 3beta-glucosyltransferase